MPLYRIYKGKKLKGEVSGRDRRDAVTMASWRGLITWEEFRSGKVRLLRVDEETGRVVSDRKVPIRKPVRSTKVRFSSETVVNPTPTAGETLVFQSPEPRGV